MESVTADPKSGPFITRGYVAPHDFGFTGFAVGRHLDVARMAPDFAWKYQPQGRADLAVRFNGRGRRRGKPVCLASLPGPARGRPARDAWGRGRWWPGKPEIGWTCGTTSSTDRRLTFEVHGQRQGPVMHLHLDAEQVRLAGTWRELNLDRWKVRVHILDPYFDFETMDGVGVIRGRARRPGQWDPAFVGRGGHSPCRDSGSAVSHGRRCPSHQAPR